MKLHFLSSSIAALLVSHALLDAVVASDDHGLTNTTLTGNDNELQYLGNLLSLSPDGKVLAMTGSCKSDDHRCERALMYQLLPNRSWTQMGDALSINNTRSSIYSIALSQSPKKVAPKGTRVVLGSADANDWGGAAVVYSWDGRKWVQVGARIDGTKPSHDHLGEQVSISSDGRRVATEHQHSLDEVYYTQ